MKQDFSLHMSEITQYLKKVVIKFNYFEELLNSTPRYVNRTDINPEDKRTFPYYRLMTGDISLATTQLEGFDPDSQSYVPLSVQALIDHPNMKVFYTNNEDSMNTLLKKYPDDQYLIERIFDPVDDIDAVIEAKDFTVISTPSGILDPYEEVDIADYITKFTYMFGYRWYMNTMEYDDLYPFAMWSLLWYLLPNAVLTRRILNMRTIRVHPFHIWMYLTSRGYEDYQGYFTRSQEHFLYRNDNYLKHNVGKKSVLDILQCTFLKPIGHTLSSKVITCNTEGSIDTATKCPDILNIKDNQVNFSHLTEFEDFLTKLHHHHYDDDNTNEHKNQMHNRFRFSSCNTLRTKFIELLNSNSNDEMMVLFKFLLDTVSYLVSVDRLQYTVNLISPDSGKEVYDVPIIVALNLMYYCIYAPTEEIPTDTIEYYTTTVALTHLTEPTFSEFIYTLDQKFRLAMVVDVEDVIGTVPYSSTNLYTSMDASILLGNQFTWLMERVSQIETTYDTLYHDCHISLYESLVPSVKVLNMPRPYATFNDIFQAYPETQDLLESLTESGHYLNMITTIFEEIIPLGIGFAKLAEDAKSNITVRKMKELFTHLTSYNITFLTSDVSRFDLFKLPPLTLHMGRVECLSHIYAFDDTAIGFEQEVDFISTSEILLEDTTGAELELHPTTAEFTIDTEEVEEIDDPDRFIDRSTSIRDIYYDDFGISMEFTGDSLP